MQLHRCLFLAALVSILSNFAAEDLDPDGDLFSKDGNVAFKCSDLAFVKAASAAQSEDDLLYYPLRIPRSFISESPDKQSVIGVTNGFVARGRGYESNSLQLWRLNPLLEGKVTSVREDFAILRDNGSWRDPIIWSHDSRYAAAVFDKKKDAGEAKADACAKLICVDTHTDKWIVVGPFDGPVSSIKVLAAIWAHSKNKLICAQENKEKTMREIAVYDITDDLSLHWDGSRDPLVELGKCTRSVVFSTQGSIIKLENLMVRGYNNWITCTLEDPTSPGETQIVDMPAGLD